MEEVKNQDDEDTFTKLNITESLKKLYDILGISKLFTELPENYKSFDIAHHIGMTMEQEYALLQLQNEADRQEAILQHLQQILPTLEETERLKDKVRLNGHFKNLKPPDF